MLSQNIYTAPSLSKFEEKNFFLYLNQLFNIFLPVNFINAVEFVDQANEMLSLINVENIQTVHHYSVPNIKLQYPEPFIAAPSFIHQDLWFMHILTYQYWLWFVFIFIIVFFFLTFLCTVRWCNNRSRPRRETRGVSRSKCGDLITACVPVSWATSIIVSESTDAIDYYDGFGTTELVVGVRAYQWGWEYYYPRDLDLNYNLKKNYSTFVGNSLKYEKSSDLASDSNNLWKFYQNKNSDQIVTPSHLLLVPSDNNKIINLLNFGDIGATSLAESNSFKKIRMISKTMNSDLFGTYSRLNNRFNAFIKIAQLEPAITSSTLLATDRQISFLNSSNFLTNSSIPLDYSAYQKVLTLNFKTFAKSNLDGYRPNNSFLNDNNNRQTSVNFFLNDSKQNSIFFKNIKFYFDYLSKINNDSDKKKINQPFLKTLNAKFIKNNLKFFNDYALINKLNFDADLHFSQKTQSLFFNFNNTNISNKNFDLTSPNQLILFPDRNIRSLATLKNNSVNPVYNQKLNSVLSEYSTSTEKFELNPYFFYKINFTNWTDSSSISRLSSSRFNIDSPYSPIPTSDSLIKTKEYDNCFKEYGSTSLVFQGKEELTPSSVSSVYWNFYFNTFNSNWRLTNPINFFDTKDLFYLPLFSFYYDYDFRNWQALELLEDAFWESSFSVYLNDEYSSILAHVQDVDSFEKNTVAFLSLNSLLNNKQLSLFDAPYAVNDSKKNINYFDSNKAPYIFQEDGIINPSILSFKDFSFLTTSSNFYSSEDSYESYKNILFFLDNNGSNVLLNSKNFFNPFMYSTVLDYFRSDFDEFSWISDSALSTNFFNLDFNLFSFENFYELNTNLSEVNNRTSDVVNLRNTAKNAAVTYNAMQKVFKTRFDENRSNARLGDFSNSYDKQPFVSSKKASYENMLGKNKINFFENVFFYQTFKKNLNNLFTNDSSLNFYFYDFPFLMALKSDPSRYLWFDWFAKWGFYEVQPSSSSRYAIFGMPYFNKAFEYSSNVNESLNEAENYFIRLSRSRKNYMTNWVYTPYMLIKNNVWAKNNIFYELFSLYSSSLIKTKFLLKNAHWYWTSLNFINLNLKTFHPSHSGLTTYNRTNWNPQSSIQSYYYSSSTLVDILTKREALYRDFFFKKNRIIALPNFLTANPQHLFLKEIKSSFLYIDKIVQQNEYSREIYFFSLNYFNYLLLSTYRDYLSNSLNLSSTGDSLFFYFFNSTFLKPSIKSNNGVELFKNQYRPMKKGISNMVRLHATGAIAMPTEMRIQILASSKDVIHSWAIPSAGIKIDCVPGYSSHRVIIFLVSGIFWGQCMEICGRYHHWMPIIIYFMKRDLFFLWCSHFIFLNSNATSLSMNDRQNVNFSKLVSFDKSAWINQF